MTISAGSYAPLSYTGNGTTTAFAVTWPFFDPAGLVVKVAGVVQTYGAAYTVSGGNDATGTVTFGTAPAAAAVVKIGRSTSAQQVTAYANAGAFPARSHEQALDRLTMLAQEIVATSLRAATADAVVNALPAAASRANQYLAFDSSGQPIVTAVPPSGSLTTSGYGASLVQTSTAATARTLLGSSTIGDGIFTAATAAAARALISALGSTDLAGQVAWFPATAAPAGWLKANGQTVSRTTYATLWAFAQASGNLAATEGSKTLAQFGPGDGATTFSVPDLRGEFVRSLDDGRGADPGRALGSAQQDAFQGHYHLPLTGSTFWGNGGSVGSGGPAGGAFAVTGTSTGAPVTDGGNGSPRTAAETRPRNVALLACIRT